MKGKLRRIWVKVYDFYEDWLRGVFTGVGAIIVLFYIFFVLVIWKPFNTVEHCYLHEFVPMNCVCIVDTLHGDVGELRVYPPHPTICNAITEIGSEGYKETYGYFTMEGGKYYHVMSEPDKNYAEVTVDGDIKYNYNRFISHDYFCKECLGLFEEANTTYPLMLADMYNLEDIKLYPLALGATYHIRHYTVVIGDELNEQGNYEIEITSNYYEGGKDLDY